MRKIYFIIALCFLGTVASATKYFPSSVTAPYAAAAQTVCIGSTNTATTVTYAVCGTTSTGTALTITPKWYLNGVSVFTGATFTSVTGGGIVTLPAGSFTYTTAGAFTGTNGLKCVLSWTTAAPAACTAGSTTITGAPTDITVIPVPAAITGPSMVCIGGSSITLTDPAAGGTWTTNNSAVATITTGTGVIISGIAGNTIITYATGCGTAATKTILVIPAPVAISGASFVCAGLNITLSDPAGGGTWSSNNTSVATVGSGTGLVIGNIAGTATITYANGCGANATMTFTVNPQPLTPAAITGLTSVCTGNTTILSDAISGGVWSSGNTSVAAIDPTGSVNGIVTGTATISYTISNSCGSRLATTSVTVQSPLALPGSITGAAVFCQGTTLALSDAVSGGIWTCSNTTVATINAIGDVSGITGGSSIISYTMSNSCGSSSAISTVTVSPLPAPVAITGNTSVCGTSVLNDVISGGIWSSSNPAVATIDATGTVTGISIGTATITYTMTNSCGTVYTTTTVTINPLPDPSAITGPATVCVGGTMTLNDLAPGGVWSSSNISVATVDAGGNVTGVGAGSSAISYTITDICGSGFAITTVTTVLLPPVPAAITGIISVCTGSTISLSDATSGGVWSSSTSSAGIAAISGLGVVTGLAEGSAVISYSLANSCGTVFVTAPVTVVSLPVAGTITGNDNICPGHTLLLSDDVSGGLWSSSIPYYATVSPTGMVTGENQGLASISYTVTNSCGSAGTGIAIDVFPAASAVCDPTAVSMVNGTATDLKVFPNSNEGTFSVEMLSGINEPVQVIITNIVGETVKEFTTTTNNVLDIQLNLRSGIYLLSASTAENRYVTKIIVR